MIFTPAALLPLDEVVRLHSLHKYDIVNSLQEDVFDELVVLSAHLFGLPISYVALVDAELSHYKAMYGYPLPPPQPRQEVLCAQVIKRNRVVLYHDLATTPQKSLDAPAIRQALTHQMRFYVGAPLRTADQHAIGTLCLVGQQPRLFSPQEQQVLERLAGIVSQLIILRQQYLGAPLLGDTYWQAVREHVRDEVHALRALVRYLLTRYGTAAPVPDEVLHLVARRLQDLWTIIQEYAG